MNFFWNIGTHTNTHLANSFINLGAENLWCKNTTHESNTQFRKKYKQRINKQILLFPYFITPWCVYYCYGITVKNLSSFREYPCCRPEKLALWAFMKRACKKMAKWVSSVSNCSPKSTVHPRRIWQVFFSPSVSPSYSHLFLLLLSPKQASFQGQELRHEVSIWYFSGFLDLQVLMTTPNKLPTGRTLFQWEHVF